MCAKRLTCQLPWCMLAAHVPEAPHTAVHPTAVTCCCPGMQTYKRAPQTWKGPEGEQIIVDKVLLTNNDEGHIVIKVPRVPKAPALLQLLGWPGAPWLLAMPSTTSLNLQQRR